MSKYILGEWDLSLIKPQDLQMELKKLERKVKKFTKKRKELTSAISTKNFLQILKQLEQIKKKSSCFDYYFHLKFSENSADQQAVADLSKVETELSKLSNQLLFFSLWFKKLPESKAKQLIQESGEYHYFLEKLRKTRDYALKENEEKIINLKDVTGNTALMNVYKILTSQFEFIIDKKRLTQEELLALIRSPDAKIRREAYFTLLNKYKGYKDVLGEIYKNIINDWREENIGLRGYKTPISVRNIANDLPDEAVETLLQVCSKNQHLFHRFFNVKRKKLGLKKLTRFDLYAPIKDDNKKISYDRALRLVLSAYQHFSPQFAAEAKKIIDGKQIHSLIQKNKQSGAFCASVSAKISPYILLNYTGKLRDVSTIAHELGHGVHHNLARENTEFTSYSCLPLAETASIFGEMLLSEKLLKEDPQKGEELLFAKLDEIYATIIRQAGFVNFEIQAHQMMGEGKTIEEMSQAYLQDLRKQLGSKVEVDEIFADEWLYVPHLFQSPFYCYAYSFGNLLTLALWKMYREQGQPFAKKIMNLFAQGGSKSPLELTRELGVDITSEKFWQKGFDAIKEMLKKIR